MSRKGFSESLKIQVLPSVSLKYWIIFTAITSSSQKEIAAGCIIEAGSLTSVLNRMENDGMIERRTLNGNRRTYHIFLTEKGRILALRVRQAFSDMEKDIFKELSQDESNHFMKTFFHIYKHLLIKED